MVPRPATSQRSYRRCRGRLSLDRVWAALALVGAILVFSSGGAQAANTGSLTGSVVDSEGTALTGATVTIGSDTLIGGKKVAACDDQGRVSFRLLPVGSYTVEVEFAGFQPATAQAQVRSNHVAAVDFRMVPEHFTSSIEVTASVPVVDTSQVNTGVVWDAEYLRLAEVGTTNRNYQQVLGQAPGVFAGNNPSVMGATVGENSYLVDGMSTTDPAFGTWGTMFNIDAIQEVNFQTGGFEAEFGQATGGLVNLVTKSGGNQFSGSLDLRYRGETFTENGDHYDRDELSEWRQGYSATLGGPILRDRLWFFTSVQFINYNREEVESHFPREWTGWQVLAKLTWQATDNHRLVFKGSTDPAKIAGVNEGSLTLPSAMGTQEQGGHLWQLELDSVLSDSWLLVAQLGAAPMFTSQYPTHGADLENGHWDEDTGLSYHNFDSTYDGPRTRDEARLAATWFVDHPAGSHEFKGGLDYSRVGYDVLDYLNGGAFVADHQPSSVGWDPVDLNGDGYFNHWLRIREPEDAVKNPITSTGTIAGAFLQDSWRPHPKLTVKPGLRYDNVTQNNQAGERIADMDRWQPRLGLAWDLKGTARHVIRASAGRFMDPTALNIADRASGVTLTTHDYTTLEYYCNLTRGAWCDVDSLPPSLGDPIPWTNWAGQQYTLIDNRGVSVTEPPRTIDQAGLGQLEAPYVDELVIAYETQPAPRTSLELTYVARRTRDIIEDTCQGNAWAWGAAPFPDLDDPSTWTRAADCTGYLYVNLPGQYRDYDAWIIGFETRPSWGHLRASYTLADSRINNLSGPSNYSFYATGDFFPLHFVGYDGSMEGQSEHHLKLNGYFLLPKSFVIGVDAFWKSPADRWLSSICDAFQGAADHRSTADQMVALGIDPATVDYCTTPDGGDLGGSYSLHGGSGYWQSPSLWQVDLQVSKSWRVGRVDLQAIITVYNVFGNEWGDTVNDQAFLQDTDDDGNPLQYQDDDPSAPYYDAYYGADSSPVLVPIGEPFSYWDPRRYEIGFRVEF